MREGNALTGRASTSGAAPVRRGGKRAARSVGDRVQSRQCPVQESRGGAGARSLSRGAGQRRSGARQPRQVQHRRDQISSGLAAAQRRGRADAGRRRSAISGTVRPTWRLRGRPLQPGAGVPVPPPPGAGAAHAQRNAATPEEKTPLRRGRPFPTRSGTRAAASATRAPIWIGARTASAPTRCPRTSPTTSETSKLRRWRACRWR